MALPVDKSRSLTYTTYN